MSFLFPKQQNPLPVVRMPDSQSPDVLEAARLQRMKMMQRGGRASTILTGNTGGASGAAPVYSNSSLSGAQ